MKLIPTDLLGAYVVDIEPAVDERGFFARTFCAKEFGEKGMAERFVQCNTSFCKHSGTIRGLHYQESPSAEAKLVRCTAGAIYDVIVDLRPLSATYRDWRAIELTSANRRALYIPEGFAHGFQTLADDTEVFYQMSEFYAPGLARGIRWDDPAIGVAWPEADRRIVSERDSKYPLL